MHTTPAAPASSDPLADWIGHVDRTEGWLHLDEAQVLRDLAAEVTRGVIVEVGSYRGRSAIALAAGARPETPVFAVDPHEVLVESDTLTYGPEDRRAFFEAMLRSGAWANVRLVNLSSEVLAAGWDRPVGLLWIDGDHTLDGVTRDWECWKPHLLPGCTVAFDDAHDPRVGPIHLIERLVADGELVHRRNVGKVRVLERPAT